MDVHLRIDSANAAHTRFTLFLNGKNCGELCATADEFSKFSIMLAYWFSSDTNEPKLDSFKRTGVSWDEMGRTENTIKQENAGGRLNDGNSERDRDRCQDELSR